MGRNYPAGQQGDAINAVLAAAGYNFRRLLAWLKPLLFAFFRFRHRGADFDECRFDSDSVPSRKNGPDDYHIAFPIKVLS
jgi:hypothetical protein